MVWPWTIPTHSRGQTTRPALVPSLLALERVEALQQRFLNGCFGFSEVPLRFLIERRFAARSTEVVGVALVFGRRSGCRLVDRHLADRIDRHLPPPRSTILRQIRTGWVA